MRCLNRFQAELGLSGAQTQKLALVLDDYSQYYQSLQDQLDDLRATGKTRIMQILDPEQRVKFEKMMNDLAPQLTMRRDRAARIRQVNRFIGECLSRWDGGIYPAQGFSLAHNLWGCGAKAPRGLKPPSSFALHAINAIIVFG